jgi:hypothetical protein
MTKLNLNLAGFSFQHGLKILESSFQAALPGLTDGVVKADAALKEYDAAGVFIGERDEETGDIYWDQSQVLAFELEMAEIARQELRKAYAIAAYHHWERYVRVWTGKDNLRTHDDMTAATLAEGYPIHAYLDRVRLLVNTLKHDNRRWGMALFEAWREAYRSDFRPRQVGRVYWAEAVSLTDNQIAELFATLAASGPTAESYPDEDEA